MTARVQMDRARAVRMGDVAEARAAMIRERKSRTISVGSQPSAKPRLPLSSSRVITISAAHSTK
jgi:hypothetical protein